MIKSQRMLIVIVLPLLALILHTTFCEWRFKARANPSRPILAYQHEQQRGIGGLRYFPHSGLFSQGTSRELAVIVGIVAPLLLLATDVYLLLGWRFQRAVARGRCPHCGYDLSGTDHTLCPECGRDVATGDSA